ncbi:MAG: roadblock/LC7 domain-containing protein [Chitinispirillaceae bacterium]|nr:roadblock/LC7 domain-containing protein [Chitinispirillaceae bacterium]
MQQENAHSIFTTVVETRGVEGVFEISTDGFILRALQSRSSDPEAIAAVIAATIRFWRKIGDDLRLGRLEWVLLEYERGRMIVAHHGNTMLVIIGSLHMIYGEVLMKVRPSFSRHAEEVTPD